MAERRNHLEQRAEPGDRPGPAPPPDTPDRPGRPAQPVVTVVIPVLNGETWLPEQLAGLEAQDYEGDWEVLAVDNGSTDGSAALLRSWEDRLPLRVVAALGNSNP